MTSDIVDDAFDVFHDAAPTSASESSASPSPAAHEHANAVADLFCHTRTRGSHDDDSNNNADAGLVLLLQANGSDGNMAGVSDQHDATTTAVSTPPATSHAAQMCVEKHSGLRLRRTTRSFAQLPLWLAEHPYMHIHDVHQHLQGVQRSGSRSSALLSRLQQCCCIGVVVSKGDAKNGGSSGGGSARRRAYAMLRLWSMRGHSSCSSNNSKSSSSSSSEHETLSLLLCDAAFDTLYTQLLVGVVLCVTDLSQLSSPSSSSSSSSSCLLRVRSSEQVRVLGYAADLGTCAAITRATGERCHVLVNTQHSTHCVYHLGAAYKTARRNSSNSNNSNTNNTTTTLASRRNSVLLSSSPSPSATSVPSLLSKSLLTLPQQQAVQRAQLLRQHTFIAVRGASGLPLPSSSSSLRANSHGSSSSRHGSTATDAMATAATDGIYAGVCRGSALHISDRIHVPPSSTTTTTTGMATRTLSAAAPSAMPPHGHALTTTPPLTTSSSSTSYGYRVLRASQRDERQRTHDALLLRALHPPTTTTASATSNSNNKDNNNNNSDDVTRKRRRVDALANAVKAQCAPLPTTPRRAFRPLATTCHVSGSNVSRNVSNNNGSSSAVTRAVVAQHDALAQLAARRCRRPAMRLRSTTNDAEKSDDADTQRRRCAGGERMTAAAAAAAAASRVKVAGQGSALVRSVVTALATNAHAHNDNNSSSNASDATHGDGDDDDAAQAMTRLGAVAARMHSSHDDLRQQDEVARLNAYLDRRIAEEKALDALRRVHAVATRAVYCVQCARYYARTPDSCRSAAHDVHARETVKRYVKCEHCHYKTFVLGDEATTRAWRVLPHCPRCKRACVWHVGDAAPAYAGHDDVAPHNDDDDNKDNDDDDDRN